MLFFLSFFLLLVRFVECGSSVSEWYFLCENWANMAHWGNKHYNEFSIAEHKKKHRYIVCCANPVYFYYLNSSDCDIRSFRRCPLSQRMKNRYYQRGGGKKSEERAIFCGLTCIGILQSVISHLIGWWEQLGLSDRRQDGYRCPGRCMLGNNCCGILVSWCPWGAITTYSHFHDLWACWQA